MKKQKFFYGWWIVAGCVIVAAVMVPLVMSLANKYLLQITTDMDISRSAFTLSSTITLGLGIFLSPFVSKALANRGFKKIQSTSVLGFALAYASFALAQNIYHFYISAFFVGIFYLNATLIPISMMITNWFVKKRGLAMSIAFTGISVGGILFSPFITFLLENYSWRMTYVIMAIIVVAVAFPISLFVFKRSPEEMGLKAYGQAEVHPTAKEKITTKKGLQLSVKESRTKMFFILLLIGMFLNGIINNGALGQFPPAIEEMYGSTMQAGIISLYSFSGIYGKLLYGWINDKFGVVASTMFGVITFIMTFIFMLLGSNEVMIYAMALVFGCGNAIGSVAPPLITAAVYGPEKYGEAYGMINSASQVGLSLGSLFVASMFDMTGSYQVSWVLLSIFAAFIAVSWIVALKQAEQFSYPKVRVSQ